MNFGDFTDGGTPAASDYIAGYAAGGGAGSDRRYAVGTLLNAYSVKSYGATGNGSTDDTAAITAADAAASTAGRSLFFPNGVYQVSSALTPSTGARWVGESYQGAVIRTSSATADIISATNSFVTIERLQFASSVTRSGGSFVAVNSTNFLIRDFYMTGAYNGITLGTSCSVIWIDHGTINSSVSVSINVLGGLATYINRVNCGGSPFAHILVNGTGDLNVSDCDLIGASYCMYIDPAAGQAAASIRCNNVYFDQGSAGGLYIIPSSTGIVCKCDFNQCWFTSCGQFGVSIEGGGSTVIDGIEFIDCQIYDNPKGIKISGSTAKNIGIIGCEIAQCTTGISLEVDCTKIRVVGNKIGAAGTYTANTTGIALSATAIDDCIIASNDFTGSTSAVSNSATGTKNRFYLNQNYDAPLLPIANDGAAIGSGSFSWSDLFLASGAVVNFNNGDATLTHASGAMTLFMNGGATALKLNNTDGGIQGARLEFIHDSASPAASDLLGEIRVTGRTSTAASITSHSFNFSVEDTTNATYSTLAEFAIRSNGSVKSLQFSGSNASLNPDANDGFALGRSSLGFSDLFLASGGVINWNAGDVTVTHSANTLAFGGASSGYTFDAVVKPSANDAAALGASGTAFSDLFLASGGVINWSAGDVTVTHSSDTLAFAGAASGYSFDSIITQSASSSAGSGTIVGISTTLTRSTTSGTSDIDVAGRFSVTDSGTTTPSSIVALQAIPTLSNANNTSTFNFGLQISGQVSANATNLVGVQVGLTVFAGTLTNWTAFHISAPSGTPTNTKGLQIDSGGGIIEQNDASGIQSAGSIVCATGALATNATTGFLYIPTCAGTPSGTPAAKTGTVAMVYDTSNNKMYVYNGAWKGGTAPGAWT